MKSILESGNLKGKRVLVRVDWNVPIENGKVVDDFRIKKSLPTLEYLENAGAKVIIATHLESENTSIRPFKMYVPKGMKLLKNLRDNPGEESNSEEFAKELASGADIYVNEAFSASHREHASIVGVPKFLPSFIGLQFAREIKELSKAFNPQKPFLFILGGAKFETKLPLVEKFLDIADLIFVGGTNAATATTMPLAKNSKIIFPYGNIGALDVDDETISLLKEKIEASEFILWNGPLGNYEKGYKKGTLELAKILAVSNKNVIVGGGDTLAAIKELNLLDKFSFVSTGGAAMLDFLATSTLPGIEVMNHR